MESQDSGVLPSYTQEEILPGTMDVETEFWTEKEKSTIKITYKSRGATVYGVFEQKSRIFCAKMLRQGWCPHKVIHLWETFEEDSLRQLSDLHVNPIRKKDHRPCLSQKSCIAYNVDLKTYRTSHCDGCPGCSFVGVPYEELINIIQHGEVPLVSIEMDNSLDQRLSIRLHTRSRSTRYTAISHVWIDGLGNPTSNSLPVCQLKALRSRLKRLHGKSNVSPPTCLKARSSTEYCR